MISRRRYDLSWQLNVRLTDWWIDGAKGEIVSARGPKISDRTRSMAVFWFARHVAPSRFINSRRTWRSVDVDDSLRRERSAAQLGRFSVKINSSTLIVRRTRAQSCDKVERSRVSRKVDTTRFALIQRESASSSSFPPTPSSRESESTKVSRN